MHLAGVSLIKFAGTNIYGFSKIDTSFSEKNIAAAEKLLQIKAEKNLNFRGLETV